MQNFQDIFETLKWSFISALSICMTDCTFSFYLINLKTYLRPSQTSNLSNL